MVPISEMSDSSGAGEWQPSDTFGSQSKAAQQALCLTRLQELVHLRRTVLTETGPETVLRRRLVDHALYSVYADCVALGMRPEADHLLAERSSPPVE